MGYVVVALCFAAALVIWVSVAEAKQKKGLEAALQSIPGFNAQYWLVSVDGHTGVAIDGDSRQVCLMSSYAQVNQHRLVPFSAVISSSVEENGDVITSTSRGGQLARAAVGGVLLGGVGAVVGALTASQRQKRRINSVELKVVVDDLARPVHTLTLQSTPGDSGGMVHTAAIRQASEWQSRFESVMRQGAPETVVG